MCLCKLSSKMKVLFSEIKLITPTGEEYSFSIIEDLSTAVSTIMPRKQYPQYC